MSSPILVTSSICYMPPHADQSAEVILHSLQQSASVQLTVAMETKYYTSLLGLDAILFRPCNAFLLYRFPYIIQK